MRQRFYPILGLSFLIVGVSSSWAQIHQPPWRDTSTWRPRHPDVQGLARTLDPQGDRNMRPPVEGALRLPMGTQIHPSCLRIAQARTGSPQSSERRINEWMNQVVSVVVDRCRSQYPELRSYIGEWISQLRRSVITCSSHLGSSIGGMLLGSDLNLYFDLNPSERRGLEPDSVGDLVSSSSLRNRPVLVLSSDFFTAAVSEFSTRDTQSGDSPGLQLQGLHMAIHELFHATSANNLGDHNAIGAEGVFGRPGGEGLRLCDHSILDDRVYVATSLCTQLSLSREENGVADELIFRRINSCGLRRGCLDLFTSDLSGQFDHLYLRSRGMPLQQARQLCARIQEAGFCRHRRTSNADEIARLNPPLVEIGNRLRERILGINPGSPAQLPLALLRAYPDLEAGVRSLTSDVCLRRAIYWGQDGNLYVRSSDPSQFRRYLERGDAGVPGVTQEQFRSLSDHLRHWQQTLVYRLGECSQPREEAPTNGNAGIKPRGTALSNRPTSDVINTILDQLRERVDRGESSDVFRMALMRSRGLAETRIPDNPRNPNTDPARMLLGASLYRDYVNTLRRYHPYSPEFDCNGDLLMNHFNRSVQSGAEGVSSRGDRDESPGTTAMEGAAP